MYCEGKKTRRKTAINENAINILAAIQLNPTINIGQLENVNLVGKQY